MVPNTVIVPFTNASVIVSPQAYLGRHNERLVDIMYYNFFPFEGFQINFLKHK